jgi:hypothetical protein
LVQKLKELKLECNRKEREKKKKKNLLVESKLPLIKKKKLNSDSDEPKIDKEEIKEMSKSLENIKLKNNVEVEKQKVLIEEKERLIEE